MDVIYPFHKYVNSMNGNKLALIAYLKTGVSNRWVQFGTVWPWEPACRVSIHSCINMYGWTTERSPAVLKMSEGVSDVWVTRSDWPMDRRCLKSLIFLNFLKQATEPMERIDPQCISRAPHV